MSSNKLTKRHKRINKSFIYRAEVAEWYLANVYPYVKDKDSEIEWLVTYLNDDAFALIEGMYDEQMSNLEDDGFFK